MEVVINRQSACSFQVILTCDEIQQKESDQFFSENGEALEIFEQAEPIDI